MSPLASAPFGDQEHRGCGRDQSTAGPFSKRWSRASTPPSPFRRSRARWTRSVGDDAPGGSGPGRLPDAGDRRHRVRPPPSPAAEYAHVPIVMVTVHDDRKSATRRSTRHHRLPDQRSTRASAWRAAQPADAAPPATRAGGQGRYSRDGPGRHAGGAQSREGDALRLAKRANSVTRKPATTSSAWRVTRA